MRYFLRSIDSPPGEYQYIDYLNNRSSRKLTMEKLYSFLKFQKLTIAVLKWFFNLFNLNDGALFLSRSRTLELFRGYQRIPFTFLKLEEWRINSTHTKVIASSRSENDRECVRIRHVLTQRRKCLSLRGGGTLNSFTVNHARLGWQVHIHAHIHVHTDIRIAAHPRSAIGGS